MKTADLIPLILYELNDSDKYGLELTKNIENKSQGAIVIKQPTLYTILKKLEKSKFISSYWLDSEIGGKRHYYSITENGKMQISTLPSFDVLIENIKNDEQNEQTNNIEISENFEPKVSILPSEEVFTDENIDTKTNLEINNNNLSEVSDKKETHKPIKQKSETKQIVIEPIFKIPEGKENNEEIKYLNFVNFKKNKDNIQAKIKTRNHLINSLVTSAYLLLVTLICFFIGKNNENKNIMFVVDILAVIISFYYPIIVLSLQTQTKISILKNGNNFCVKRRTIFAVISFIVGVVAVVLLNFAICISSYNELFSINNFANFYTPIIVLTTLFFNLLTSSLLLKKK